MSLPVSVDWNTQSCPFVPSVEVVMCWKIISQLLLLVAAFIADSDAEIDESHGSVADDTEFGKGRSVCQRMPELPIRELRGLASDDTEFGKPHPTRWKLPQLPAHGLDIVVCRNMSELPIHE